MIANFVLSVLSTTAVSVFLLAGFTLLLRTWITERLKNAVKHEYDREIEAYKSVLTLVQSATSEGQKAAVEARLRAFDRVWAAFLLMRNMANPITTYLEVLTIEEYGRLKSDPKFQQLFGTFDRTRLERMYEDKNVEQARPYIGEIVWALFYAYLTVISRFVLLQYIAASDEDRINWVCRPRKPWGLSERFHGKRTALVRCAAI